jgi:L-iduronidase
MRVTCRYMRDPAQADPLGGWNKNVSWRGDARYGAMMVKVVAQRLSELSFNRSLPLLDFDLSSNDDAFLNYGDVPFGQRTLVARFEYNQSTPHTVQVAAR